MHVKKFQHRQVSGFVLLVRRYFFYELILSDLPFLGCIKHFDCVVHLAASKAPLELTELYKNNLKIPGLLIN